MPRKKSDRIAPELPRAARKSACATLADAEEIDEDADAVSIFEISGDDESGLLLPLDDDTLIEELFADFMADYDPEYTEDDGDLVN